jgi:alpha-1,2-mannosyltransferase
MYGSWDPTASYDATAFVDYAATHRFSLVNQLGMWVSPGRGILVWTPVILLLLPALKRSWSAQTDWSKGLLAAGLIYTVVQATLNRFSGGDRFYAYRLGLEFLACAFPAFALASRHMGPWARRLIGPLIALQFVAIMLGAVRDGYYYVLPDVAWTDNGFMVAFRGNPAGVGALVIYAVVVSVLISRSRWFSPPATAPLQQPTELLEDALQRR